MVILCGVDGSAPAREAARAATALAKRAGEALQLLYVQDVFVMNVAGPDGAGAGSLASQQFLEDDRRRMGAELEALAAALTREFHTEVSQRIEVGSPESELSRCAQELRASFLVVGALGRRQGSMWRLGSVADRLSQSAPVPVLVVRTANGFARWALEDQPLRVVVALGSGSSTALALETVSDLRRLGPCEVVEAHAYDPRREAQRLGFASPEEVETRRAIEGTLARELPARFAEQVRAGEARFVALPAQGHVAETLAEFVENERADLTVAGSRERGALQRRFLGSVSYGLVGLSPGNVLVAHGLRLIPEVQAPRAPASVRRALVATDLSESGNRAVDYALGLLPEGGQLVLLHVLPAPAPRLAMELVPDPLRKSPEERRMSRSLAEAELRKLLPAQGRALEVEVEATEAEDVSKAILQAAERHGVDLVLVGRHGHGRIGPLLLGSIARRVAQRSSRPVLVVPEAGGAG
ncbi:MAG: universal stress protein [Planctomycetes bacterium]|nr:universal stress protein [Planctomycetota bacterium]